MRAITVLLLLALSFRPVPARARERPENGRVDLETLIRKGPPWRPDDVTSLRNRLVGDPARFRRDPKFREAVLHDLENVFPPDGPFGLKEMLLFGIDDAGELSFDDFERLQRKWGAAPRRSLPFERQFREGTWRFPSDVSGAIEASVYSLPSEFFTGDEAAGFLEGVRRRAPDREVLAFVDPYMRLSLEPVAGRLGVVLLDTYGRKYTPWTRDVMSFVRARSGSGILVLVRPDAPLQRGRRGDNLMGRELLKDLPGKIFRSWGSPRWARAPIPFHNGQVILTPREAWVSIHTLEPRALEILHERRVPVSSFGTERGIGRYVAAVERAAAELARLYGRPVRFVHALPGRGSRKSSADLMETLGGGAGFDLDSVVTILVEPDGGEAALVASVKAGKHLLDRLEPDEEISLRRAYGLEAGAGALGKALRAYQETERPSRLDSFLDATAAHLSDSGLAVRRLPIVLVPVNLLGDRNAVSGEKDFLIGWNNVVPETGARGFRAEGFSSRLPAGDELATAIYREIGYRLELLPPLIPSVIRNGAYRCASNQLREAPATSVEPDQRNLR